MFVRIATERRVVAVPEFRSRMELGLHDGACVVVLVRPEGEIDHEFDRAARHHAVARRHDDTLILPGGGRQLSSRRA